MAGAVAYLPIASLVPASIFRTSTFPSGWCVCFVTSAMLLMDPSVVTQDRPFFVIVPLDSVSTRMIWLVGRHPAHEPHTWMQSGSRPEQDSLRIARLPELNMQLGCHAAARSQTMEAGVAHRVVQDGALQAAVNDVAVRDADPNTRRQGQTLPTWLSCKKSLLRDEASATHV